MNKLIITLIVLFLSFGATVFADQGDQVITLKDGSQIKGQLAGIDNGIYTVKTPIIGDVHVAASDVASITNASAAPGTVQPMNDASTVPASPSSGTTPNMDQQIAASQKQLMSNPESMATLQEMMQDPDIIQALQDPAVVQAVTSHDYQAVQSNPKIQALMENPKMQALLQKLAAQQQQQQQAPAAQ
jgi:hypothetical protein